MPTVSQAGILKFQNWVSQQRKFRSANPRHRVVIDAGMESVYVPSCERLIERAYANSGSVPKTVEELRCLDLSRIFSQIIADQDNPVGGAGGLGTISETQNWTGARYGRADQFGLMNISLLHSKKRAQSFEGHRQKVQYFDVSPEGKDGYHYLGDFISVQKRTGDSFEDLPVDVWMFDGYKSDGDFVPAFRLSVPGITGELYPHCESMENLAQMHVLGQGGFRLAQHFGLLGKDDAIADLVIGHDGHTAFFKFNLFLWFYEKYDHDTEAALQATRKLCVATIHAPQNGTIPRTKGEMVQQFYPPDAERLWGSFAEDFGKGSNALFVEMRTSKATGVVSPIHLMVTAAEEKATCRKFSSDALNLLPDNIRVEDLKIFPDTIDVESWLGVATQLVLDNHFEGWRQNPGILGQQNIVDSAVANSQFRKDLAEAFTVQDEHFSQILKYYLPRVFNVDVPENAIVFASLRRATQYKIGLLTSFLQHHKIFGEISQKLGRPILYLFGGIAHKDDSSSIDALERLLNDISTINDGNGAFKADYIKDYDYYKAKWVFPGLSRRGCWVGATDPFSTRSQGTEAFGPSYLKSAMNGLYIMGSDDGGAGCLRNLPTVSIYGPATFAGGTSFHNDLWSNPEIARLSRFLLSSGFIRVFEKVATNISSDLDRFEKGRGAYAPGMEAKIRSMFQTIADYNGRVLMNAYLQETGR
ncbi:MAG: hypothetical protein WC527_07690 [Candidatus Margulisiibacteriota bacterium]